MKKIILSTLAVLTLGTVGLSANDVTLYTDANGQLFTTAGEGRTQLQSKAPTLASHASKLKFSGLTYIGYRFNDYKSDSDTVDYKDDTSNFELRRAYFQLKAYLLDDPKSYYRVTFDAHQNSENDMVVRMKYGYLYLNDILPFTGVELGLVHRPWHDYEEHNSWYFRDISKVLIEESNSAHLSNSADFGFNFKTKTKYFDSEIGVFNGEGYHSDMNDDAGDSAGTGMSAEWRATAHIFGVNGKDKQDTKTYFDASFFGQYNVKHTASASGKGYDDLVFMGLHTVYNQPSFLISAQYVVSTDTADNSSYVSAQAGSGLSVNGEYRLGENKEYRVLARYDSWTKELLNSSDETAQNMYIIGAAWDQSDNVQWVANATITDNEEGNTREKYNGVAYMLTAQVEF
jgi:hypothetical protein